MIALDVHYSQNQAVVAGVLFDTWDQIAPVAEITTTVFGIQPYESGSFYKRELPCLMELLEKVPEKPNIIVIDGHVFLDGHAQPGLGKYLFDALGGHVPVLGVAKRGFHGIHPACQVFRGASQNPIYVSAAGISLEQAKEWIQSMHGPFRIPTLLKRADQLCRGK